MGTGKVKNHRRRFEKRYVLDYDKDEGRNLIQNLVLSDQRGDRIREIGCEYHSKMRRRSNVCTYQLARAKGTLS